MKRAASIAALLAATAFPTIAIAQADPSTTTPATQEEASGLGDIVVTAQRRAESMQGVPIAVSVLTGDDLTKTGAQNTNDLSQATPGLQMPVSRTVVTPYLRGVGTQNSGAGEEGSIATYVDGVYIAALSSATLAFNNIERVEVLKGPQGTLFGRNATGGLIHVITKDPSHTTQLTANVGYANYDTWSGSAYATTGLTDKIAVDLAGYFSHQGNGFGKNIARAPGTGAPIPGVTGKDVNYNREWAVRSKLLFEPADTLRFTLAGDFSHRNSDLGSTRQVIFGRQLTCRGQICDVPAVQALITRNGQPIYTVPNLVAAGGRAFSGGVYDTSASLGRYNKFETYGGSLKGELDIGNATLTSTTAYRHVLNDQNFDQDGGPLLLADTRNTEKTKTFQQELLLVGDAGRLDYTMGLFYFYAQGGTFPLAVRGAGNFNRFSVLTTDSYAGFMQGTYHLTDSTGITAGVRYTIDKRRAKGRDEAVPAGTPVSETPTGPLINPVPPQSETFKKVTYRFALDQKVSDQVFAYAAYSRGFKSGVYNVTNFRDPAALPETLDSIEVGVKTDLLDRTLRVNLSAFHYDYKDIQLLVVPAPGITRIINAASAKVKGGDLEIVVAPPVAEGRLRFNINASYIHGRYGRFDNMPVLVPRLNAAGVPTGGSVQLAINTSGQTTIRTPKFTANIGVDYVHPVGNGDLGFNVGYYFNSGFYWDPDNRIEQKSYDLLNAQISYKSEAGWSMAVFGRNLTDKFYYNQVSTSAGVGDQFTAGAPRTYGITLGFKLGG